MVTAFLKAFQGCSMHAPYYPCPIMLGSQYEETLRLSFNLCLWSHECLNTKCFFVNSHGCVHSDADSWIPSLRLSFNSNAGYVLFLCLVATVAS